MVPVNISFDQKPVINSKCQTHSFLILQITDNVNVVHCHNSEKFYNYKYHYTAISRLTSVIFS
jgi:hypothetical protein